MERRRVDGRTIAKEATKKGNGIGHYLFVLSIEAERFKPNDLENRTI